MMRKPSRNTAAGLALGMMLAAPMLVTPRADAYPPLPCQGKIAHGYATETIGSRLFGEIRTISIHVAVGYTSCRYPGHQAWAKPKWWRLSTNVSGTHMDCAGSPGIESIGNNRGHYTTQFDAYFSDFGGRNWHPKRRFVPCESDTTNTILRYFDTRAAEKMYFYPGETNPRARIAYTVVMAGSGDPSGSIRVNFGLPS